MSEQNTQTQDPSQTDTKQEDSVEKSEDWQKRYKDLQAEYTKRAQHEKELEKSMQDLQTNYEQLTQYLSQKQAPAEDDTAYEYVSKRDLVQMQQAMAQQIEATNLAAEFRSKYPDMVEYEDMVSYYLQNKTDKRKNLRERMESAVGSAKDFLEAERQRGIELERQKAEQKLSEEAQASGISSHPAPQEGGPPAAESQSDYLAFRRKKRHANLGL